MAITPILGIIIGILLLVILILLFNQFSNKRDELHEDLDIQDPSSHGAALTDKFNTTLTPNSARNQTAPLEKGHKHKRRPISAAQAALHAEQLAGANKDETLLPQSATSHQKLTQSTANVDNNDDDETDALTHTQSK